MSRHSRTGLACIVFFLGALEVQATTSMATIQSEQRDSEGGDKNASQPEKASTPESETSSGFGGPDQVDVLMAEDEASVSRIVERRLLEPYFRWKASLSEDLGLSFGIDYSLAYLASDTDSPDAETSAGSGMGRFFGSWDLVGRGSGNTGALVWKIEQRHRYTKIPASDLGFSLGYAGLIEPPFSNQNLRWTNLYWRQGWNQGKATVFAGFMDATDYLDVYALASPWTGFLNFAFSTGTQTIPVPNDAAFGIAGGTMISKQVFLIGGLVDRNGEPTAPFDGLGSFFRDNQYFKSVELGWTPSQDRIYLDNVHLTFWHADEREDPGEPSGWGFNGSVTRYIGGWMPFLRAGYAREGGSLMQKSVSTGIGYQPVPRGDLLGFGFNWGQPNEDTFGSGLRDQYSFEVFYRWQLTPRTAITPDLQFLINPALDTERDQIWIFGLRVRVAL